MSHYCTKCKKTLNDNQFYRSLNLEKYPDQGMFNECKQCQTMHVDNWNPDTYMWILQEADVPYIKSVWDDLLVKYGKDPTKMSGMTIIGRYLSMMKLKPRNEYRWADTERLAEEEREKKRAAMRSGGMTDDEIAAELAIDTTPERPKIVHQAPVQEEWVEPEEMPDSIGDQLTEEDKLLLTMRWGTNYTWTEKVKMEKLYNDMLNSYDVQGAGHMDTLRFICKASLKMDQLLDAGDIDGFNKMARSYDTLMKSGKFKNLWTVKNFSSSHWGLVA